MEAVDQVAVNFGGAGRMALNVCLAFIMFGVALDLKVDDFRRVFAAPRALLVGLTSQLVLLPAVTIVLVLLFDPIPSVALGMVLVSVCPGGNFSNFLSAVAGANSALSISLTTVVTAAAFVVTPVNFMLWSSLLPSAGGAGQPLTLDPVELAMVLALIIVTPSALGVALATRKPDWTARIRRPIRLASVVILFLFVVGAIAVNGQVFLRYGGPVLGMVVAHNTLAFAAGYGLGTAARLPERDRRTVCIETGIQNSGLALVLIFGFFDGLGGMALVAACWGLWHLISGSILARYWAKRPADVEEDPSPPPALEASAA